MHCIRGCFLDTEKLSMNSNRSKLSIIIWWFWLNLKVIQKLHRSNTLETVVFSKILKVFAFYLYPIGSWVADQSSIISHWIWWLKFDIFGILTNLISFYTDLDITIVFCVPKYPLCNSVIHLPTAVCPGWTFEQILRLSSARQIC